MRIVDKNLMDFEGKQVVINNEKYDLMIRQPMGDSALIGIGKDIYTEIDGDSEWTGFKCLGTMQLMIDPEDYMITSIYGLELNGVYLKANQLKEVA